MIIEIDGSRKIDNTFSELQELSPYVEFLSAYQRGSEYVFATTGWSWARHGYIAVRVSSKTVFKKIVVKYDEYV